MNSFFDPNGGEEDDDGYDYQQEINDYYDWYDSFETGSDEDDGAYDDFCTEDW